MTADVRRRVEALVGEAVVAEAAVGGGCIADARAITTASGARYFMKQPRPGQPSQMLAAETHGLRTLAATGAVRVPNVAAAEADLLVLEYVETGAPGHETYAELGRSLAALHDSQGETFGLEIDNFLGSSPQHNRAEGDAATSWATFYAEHRLRFQLDLAEAGGRADGELRRRLERLIDRLPTLLAGTEEPPTLIHGDLWGGNHLVDTAGRGWLIDPAISYAHRELELAMTTLFGGYPEAFHAAYREALPLPGGWRDREPLYQLYHLLNHLNLFGQGYRRQVIDVLGHYDD